MIDEEVRFDLDRWRRTGIAEAVFSSGKTIAQLDAIVSAASRASQHLLLTRLSPEQFAGLPTATRGMLDYDDISRTAILGAAEAQADAAPICIVTAGTSDLPVAREAQRTLAFYGTEAPVIADVGVAGLWRLLEQIDRIRQYRVIIAVAGMEGALFSVLAGLVTGVVIAVPSSVGYGVGQHGAAALSSALASCAPGVVTVNIDNGFGAAAAALKMCPA